MKYLIMIDMQNDFVSGIFGTAQAQALVPKVIKFLNSFNYNEKSDINLYITLDTHSIGEDTLEAKTLPEHCVENIEGSSYAPGILQAIECWPNTCVFKKNTFASIDLAKKIKDINPNDEVFIFGLCTDICVISNALMLRAFNPQVKISVISNLCAGTTPENHQKALDIMKMNLIEIKKSVAFRQW